MFLGKRPPKRRLAFASVSNAGESRGGSWVIQAATPIGFGLGEKRRQLGRHNRRFFNVKSGECPIRHGQGHDYWSLSGGLFEPLGHGAATFLVQPH